jgi:nucleoside-diphosphate-sugar epimerase
MKVLITGGSGFIGSHIVDRLISEGNEVCVLDLWESEEVKLHNDNPNYKFVKGSILDDSLVSSNIKNKTHLIHFAAVLGTSETITTYDVEQVALTNVVGTVKMLKHARDYGIKRVCVPTTPDVPWINPYKITKAAVEKFAQLFSINYGVEVVSLKLGNIYGPRERWLDGPKEAPYNYQKIIPTILMSSLKGEVLPVYGSGEQKSEYIYVGDVVESCIRVLESEKDLGGEIIHVGRGTNNSVNEIIEAVESAWGRKIDKEYVNMRPGEFHIEIALDPTNLKELLDYELQWDLIIGLKATFEYYEVQHSRLARSLDNL